MFLVIHVTHWLLESLSGTLFQINECLSFLFLRCFRFLLLLDFGLLDLSRIQFGGVSPTCHLNRLPLNLVFVLLNCSLLLGRVSFIQTFVLCKVPIFLVHVLCCSDMFSRPFESLGQSWFIFVETSTWHVWHTCPLFLCFRRWTWFHFIWSREVTIVSVSERINRFSLWDKIIQN